MSRLWADIRGDLVGKAVGRGQRIPCEPLKLKHLTRKIPETPRRRRNVPPALRWEIWERDDFTCRHCGDRRFLTIDHIVPWVRGGDNTPGNLQTLCRSCNLKKYDRYEL